eukprot:2536575-Amphidinium_carterae.2
MDAIVSKDTPRKPWICVMDTAPVQIAAEFWKDMRANIDWVKLVFVGPGMTSTCQPFDKAIKNMFKNALQRFFCEAFSKELLENMEQEDFVLKQGLQGIMENRTHLVEWVAQAMDSVSTRP